MVRYTAKTTAPPEVVWPLLAEPRRWSRWAPHVRGAWGLEHDEISPGHRILVRLVGVVPVPAEVTTVEHGRRWAWRVAGVTLGHAVTPAARGGSTVEMTLSALGPIEALLARTYGPVVALVCRRLAVAADRDHAAALAAAPVARTAVAA